jgi:hypothetical protein
MFVAPCPECGDDVSIPSNARDTARVRCPLCSAEFTVADAIAHLPPAVIMLDSPEVAFVSSPAHAHAAVGGGTESDVATLVRDEPLGDFSLAAAEERSEKPSYSFDADTAGGGTATKTRPSVSAKPRPKKPAKNPILEFVKIALGGGAAIPIALLILWWAFGKDPFDAGPWVAQYVPAIVPAKFHGEPVEAQPTVTNNNDNKKNDEGESLTANNKQKNKQQPRPEPTPQLQNLENPFDLTPDPAPPMLDPGSTLPIDPLGPGLQIDPLFPDDLDKKSTQTPPANDKPGVRNAPNYTAAELGEAVETAATALQAWEQGSDEAAEKQKLSRNLYTQFAKLGEKVTFVDASDRAVENHLPRIREMLVGFQAEPEIMAMINRVGPAWFTMDVAMRGTKGIVVIGKVKSIVQQGSLFETRLELENMDKTVVTVVSNVDPADHYKVDRRLMVLGVVIAEPSLELNGYEGSDNSVIFGGYPVPLADL